LSTRNLPAPNDDVGADDLPQEREERNCMPSHTQARKLLSKCIELPEYAHWSFDDYFDKAALAGTMPPVPPMDGDDPLEVADPLEVGPLSPSEVGTAPPVTSPKPPCRPHTKLPFARELQ
jgi:hypothetical protein